MKTKTPKRIAIVGGGTAGLVTALILKYRLNADIDLIYSSKVGIVGVGEGSTEHWRAFMDFINVTPRQVIKECDATVKIGIMFQNWASQDYMHSVQTPYSYQAGQTLVGYLRRMADKTPSKDMSLPTFWNNQIHVSDILNPGDSPSNQFHFNTNSLNTFLMKQAKAANINIIDDEITDVELNSDGEIDTLTGTSGNKYDYDFYVDCTGFKRILISKLGAKWKSYSKYLKINAAIAFPTEDPEEYNAWTLTRAMDYGWMWHIPVWGRAGNGYVYDSSYITAEQAKEEVERVLGRKVDVARSFNFDPGCVDTFWIKNCVALGLSSSFIEPLEASSIGSTIQQAFLLMHAVADYNDSIVEKYNEQNTQLLDNICDYVRLHYQTDKTNTPFWVDARNMPMSPFLETMLKHWKTHIPTSNDFDHLTPYTMFKAVNFAMVIQGLGLYDPAAYKKHYMQLSSFIKTHELNQFNDYMSQRKIAVPHKEAIRMIREVA